MQVITLIKFRRLRKLWALLRQSGSQFLADGMWTNAAALSYYTIFSLPPMLLIILQTASVFLEGNAVQSSLFGLFREVFGRESANQLVQTVDNYGLMEGTWWSVAIGIIGLFITSTTVFVTLQQSLNQIFRIKPKPEKALWLLIRNRLISFAYLLGLGFIFLVSLLLNTLIDALGRKLAGFIPEISTIILTLAGIALPILVVVLLFASIFRWLPDVRLPWRDIWVGSILTGILFTLGKYGISFYIQQSRTPNLYEAAGSVMVVLLWVFYASVIFFFGAVFTRQFALEKEHDLRPTLYATKVEQQVVETPAAGQAEEGSKGHH